MKFYLFLILSITAVSTQAQQKTEVADNTIKIKAIDEKAFYYGFAKGDQIIFSFKESKGKKMKEVEVLEYPGSSKFMKFKTKKIDEKKINVTETGIYKFKFKNGALTKRVCSFQIHRIPASEKTVNFNTTVKWQTEYDTTYYTEQEKYLLRKDTIINNITEQVAKVHSVTNLNGNSTSINFDLPKNTVVWSYYIGVDQKGQEAFAKATNELSSKVSPVVRHIPGYGPLAALALEGTSLITTLQKGEDIDYTLTSTFNSSYGPVTTELKSGKVINESSRITAPLKGKVVFNFKNDNALKGVQVYVNVTAIQVFERWATRPVTKMKVTSKEVPYLQE